jgi:hypothetical protein
MPIHKDNPHRTACYRKAAFTVRLRTIRLKLLKIGAQVRLSVRRLKVAMASACRIPPVGATAQRLVWKDVL